jgi:carbonic anhydrase
MSQILEEVLIANQTYVNEFGDKGQLPLPPARRFAILTCMDARLDPAKFAGLSEGDAHVIRNAGGRASDDAIRSLVISYKLLSTPAEIQVSIPLCRSDRSVRRIDGVRRR